MVNVPFVELPRLMGHRGAAAVAPENTIPGIEACKAAGVDWVELDVLPTLDGHAVMSHDDLLTRCCSEDRLISATKLAALGDVDAARAQWSTFSPAVLPTLSGMLEALASLDMGLNLELKSYPETHIHNLIDGVKEAFAYSTVELRGYYWSSFNLDVMKIIQLEAPMVPRALISETFDEGQIRAAVALGCFAINPDAKTLTPELVILAKDQGLQVGTWTINDVDQAKRAWDMGVDCVITDDPARLLPHVPLHAGQAT